MTVTGQRFVVNKKMADRSREKGKTRRERKRRKSESDEIEKRKHYETFYEKPPPGIIKEREEAPDDCIPDLPENQEAKKFLAKAPSKGLWMPLGKEVKVMKCWRCKAYGHRTGDRECPLFISGNLNSEKFRMAHEDPMYEFVKSNKKAEKEIRVEQLKALLQESTTSESESEDSRDEHKHRNKSKMTKEKKRNKHKQHGKKKKHKVREKPSSSDTDSSEHEHRRQKRSKHRELCERKYSQ